LIVQQVNIYSIKIYDCCQTGSAMISHSKTTLIDKWINIYHLLSCSKLSNVHSKTDNIGSVIQWLSKTDNIGSVIQWMYLILIYLHRNILCTLLLIPESIQQLKLYLVFLFIVTHHNSYFLRFIKSNSYLDPVS